VRAPPFMTRRATALAFAISALASASSAVKAFPQSVRGVVRDVGGVPVPGVVVQLLDSASAVRGQVLTDESGRFVVSAQRAGTFRVQSRRIGFKPVVSDPFALAMGEQSPRDFQLAGIPSGLDSVKIGGRNVCGRASQEAAATATAWEQVRTAIAAAEIASTMRMITTTVSYNRRHDEFGWRILNQSTDVQTEFVTQPWQSWQPSLLSQSGYIGVGADSMTYRAPGLEALASTNFIDDHCFRIVAGRDRAHIGIYFEPTPERKALGDIRGTVFIDRKTSELREMEFAYVWRDKPDLADGARGSMGFTQLKNGAWVITKWELRMPMKEVRLTQGGGRVANVGSVDTKVVTTGVRVQGGELAMARIGIDTLFAKPPIVLRGELRDSATGRALPGARVSLRGVDQSAGSDARGTFQMSNMLPGEYTVLVSTPGLDSLGVPYESDLSVTDGKDPVRLNVLSSVQVVNRLCGTSRERRAIPGILLGAASNPQMGPPPAGTKVSLEWTDKATGAQRTANVPVDEQGSFTLCGVPTGTAIVARAVSDSLRSDPETIVLAHNKPLESFRLIMATKGAATASFTGTVVADSGRAMVEDAEVIFADLQLSVHSDARGAFRLRDVPTGTHKITVRKPGYGPMNAELSFAANETLDRRIVLSRVTVLNEVVVTAAARRLQEFEDNRKTGLGVFMTREFLETQGDRPLAAIIGNTPGVWLRHGINSMSGQRNANAQAFIASSRQCHPKITVVGSGTVQNCSPCFAQVWIDDHRMTFGGEPFDINTIDTGNIEAIEYYKGGASLPAKYLNNDNACGTFVVHTKLEVRKAP
jgi:hypothetical protein